MAAAAASSALGEPSLESLGAVFSPNTLRIPTTDPAVVPKVKKKPPRMTASILKIYRKTARVGEVRFS